MADMAKRVRHLDCRGGRFYFRMRVPLALVECIGRREVSEALGDVSKAQAVILVQELARRWNARFLDEKHKLGLTANPPAEVLRDATAADVSLIARATARALLARDEEVRIGGIRSEAGDHWLDTVQDIDRGVAGTVSGEDTTGLWHRFLADLRAHGLKKPAEATEARQLLYAWAAEQGRALEGIDARSKGRAVETPPAVAVDLARAHDAAQPRRLRDAFDVWRASVQRPAKTVEAFERHLAMFEAMASDPPLSALRRLQAMEFRDALQAWAMEKGKTAATASNILTSIKALANIATDRGWLDGRPFERLTVTQGGRRARGASRGGPRRS